MCGGRLVPDIVPSGLKYVTSGRVYGLALCVRLKDDKAPPSFLLRRKGPGWAFRDAECAFSASEVSGGTAHGMILAICLDKLTGKSIDDFKDYLKCQEGALDCSIPEK
jgi:hypothetical protein